MAVDNGSNIFVKIGTKDVTGITTNAFTSAADMIEITTKKSAGGAKEYMVGELNRTFSASGLMDPDSTDFGFFEAIAAQEARTPLAFVYGGIVIGDDILSGLCHISNVTKDDAKSSASTFSCDFQVTGVVTKAVVTV